MLLFVYSMMLFCWYGLVVVVLFCFLGCVVASFFKKELRVLWVGRGRGSGRTWCRQGYDQIYLNSKIIFYNKKEILEKRAAMGREKDHCVDLWF